MLPAQMLGVPAMPMVPVTAFTATVFVATHVAVFETPITVYTVAAVGLTTLVDVFGPNVQLYEVAPLAVSVLDLPAQITPGFAMIEIFG